MRYKYLQYLSEIHTRDVVNFAIECLCIIFMRCFIKMNIKQQTAFVLDQDLRKINVHFYSSLINYYQRTNVDASYNPTHPRK